MSWRFAYLEAVAAVATIAVGAAVATDMSESAAALGACVDERRAELDTLLGIAAFVRQQVPPQTAGATGTTVAGSWTMPVLFPGYCVVVEPAGPQGGGFLRLLPQAQVAGGGLARARAR